MPEDKIGDAIAVLKQEIGKEAHGAAAENEQFKRIAAAGLDLLEVFLRDLHALADPRRVNSVSF